MPRFLMWRATSSGLFTSSSSSLFSWGVYQSRSKWKELLITHHQCAESADGEHLPQNSERCWHTVEILQVFFLPLYSQRSKPPHRECLELFKVEWSGRASGGSTSTTFQFHFFTFTFHFHSTTFLILRASIWWKYLDHFSLSLFSLFTLNGSHLKVESCRASIWWKYLDHNSILPPPFTIIFLFHSAIKKFRLHCQVTSNSYLRISQYISQRCCNFQNCRVSNELDYGDLYAPYSEYAP